MSIPTAGGGKAVPGLRQSLMTIQIAYPSAEDRLPKSLHFAESDVIIGVVRARSVHKVCYGHNCDEAA